MPKPLNVLILEDNPADAELLLIELRRAGYEPAWQLVDNEKGFTAYLKPELDVILSDYSLPQFSGLQALKLRNESGYDIPFIIVSGAISEEIAVEYMREGAADYLFKDRLGRLGMAVDNAIKEKRLRDQKQQADQMLQENEEYLKTIFETTCVATAVIEEDTTLSMVNKEFEVLSGYSKEELEGKKSWTEFVSAEDLKRMQEYHRQRRIDPEKH
ncbi:MAG: PAS domain S-box protein [Chloroflexota bacterium]